MMVRVPEKMSETNGLESANREEWNQNVRENQDERVKLWEKREPIRMSVLICENLRRGRE